MKFPSNIPQVQLKAEGDTFILPNTSSKPRIQGETRQRRREQREGPHQKLDTFSFFQQFSTSRDLFARRTLHSIVEKDYYIIKNFYKTSWLLPAYSTHQLFRQLPPTPTHKGPTLPPLPFPCSQHVIESQRRSKPRASAQTKQQQHHAPFYGDDFLFLSCKKLQQREDDEPRRTRRSPTASFQLRFLT